MSDTPKGAAPAIQLVVGAAIVNSLENPTHLLCAQRSYPAELRGKWELPGGKVDAGESPEAALHRELREELGVQLTVGSLVPAETSTVDSQTLAKWQQIYADGGKYADSLDETPTQEANRLGVDWPLVANLWMRVWVCQLKTAQLLTSSSAVQGDLPQIISQDGGHQELRWVPWDDLEELDWLPADYPILQGISHALGI